MQQATDHLEFVKHGAKTYQKVLPQVDHEYCLWVEQVEDLQSHWTLNRISSWLKMQSVHQEPSLVNNMTQERMTRGGEVLRRNASLVRTRQTSHDNRTERYSSTTVEGTSSEVI